MEDRNGMNEENSPAEWQLLREIRAGSDPAFTRLVGKYANLLRSQTIRFSKETEREEAYQDACLALHRAAMKYQPSERVTFGLFAKICIGNALKTKYRQDVAALSPYGKHARPVSLVPFEEDHFLAAFSDRMVEEEELEDRLSSMKSVLSEYECLVFDLCVEGLNAPEIADRLGKDEKSVQNAVCRMRQKLKARHGHH